MYIRVLFLIEYQNRTHSSIYPFCPNPETVSHKSWKIFGCIRSIAEMIQHLHNSIDHCCSYFISIDASSTYLQTIYQNRTNSSTYPVCPNPETIAHESWKIFGCIRNSIAEMIQHLHNSIDHCCSYFISIDESSTYLQTIYQNRTNSSTYPVCPNPETIAHESWKIFGCIRNSIAEMIQHLHNSIDHCCSYFISIDASSTYLQTIYQNRTNLSTYPVCPNPETIAHESWKMFGSIRNSIAEMIKHLRNSIDHCCSYYICIDAASTYLQTIYQNRTNSSTYPVCPNPEKIAHESWKIFGSIRNSIAEMIKHLHNSTDYYCSCYISIDATSTHLYTIYNWLFVYHTTDNDDATAEKFDFLGNFFHGLTYQTVDEIKTVLLAILVVCVGIWWKIVSLLHLLSIHHHWQNLMHVLAKKKLL